MSDKLKAVDCQKLIADMVRDDVIVQAITGGFPSTFVVQSFIDALLNQGFSSEEIAEIAEEAGDIAKGFRITRDEMAAAGLLPIVTATQEGEETVITTELSPGPVAPGVHGSKVTN